jgi:hypothetical protein
MTMSYRYTEIESEDARGAGNSSEERGEWDGRGSLLVKGRCLLSRNEICDGRKARGQMRAREMTCSYSVISHVPVRVPVVDSVRATAAPRFGGAARALLGNTRVLD